MQNFEPVFPAINKKPINDLNETLAIANKLASFLQSGDVLALWGDLGVGKSTLARAIIQSLCGSETDVPSPTFTLVQTYEAPVFDLWHMDLYRLETPDDVFELGIEDAFHDCVSLIEWPDKMGGYLPMDRLDIILQFDPQDKNRMLELQGNDLWAKRLETLFK